MRTNLKLNSNTVEGDFEDLQAEIAARNAESLQLLQMPDLKIEYANNFKENFVSKHNSMHDIVQKINSVNSVKNYDLSIKKPETHFAHYYKNNNNNNNQSDNNEDVDNEVKGSFLKPEKLLKAQDFSGIIFQGNDFYKEARSNLLLKASNDHKANSVIDNNETNQSTYQESYSYASPIKSQAAEPQEQNPQASLMIEYPASSKAPSPL